MLRAVYFAGFHCVLKFVDGGLVELERGHIRRWQGARAGSTARGRSRGRAAHDYSRHRTGHECVLKESASRGESGAARNGSSHCRRFQRRRFGVVPRIFLHVFVSSKPHDALRGKIERRDGTPGRRPVVSPLPRRRSYAFHSRESHQGQGAGQQDELRQPRIERFSSPRGDATKTGALKDGEQRASG
jgi:hypothetical protein